MYICIVVYRSGVKWAKLRLAHFTPLLYTTIYIYIYTHIYIHIHIYIYICRSSRSSVGSARPRALSISTREMSPPPSMSMCSKAPIA